MSKVKRDSHKVTEDQLAKLGSFNPRPLHALSLVLAKDHCERHWSPKAGFYTAKVECDDPSSLCVNLSLSDGQAHAVYNDGGTVVDACWPCSCSADCGPVSLFADDISAIGKPQGNTQLRYWYADGLIGYAMATKGCAPSDVVVADSNADNAVLDALMDLSSAVPVDITSDLDTFGLVASMVDEMRLGKMDADTVEAVQGTTHLHVLVAGNGWSIMMHRPCTVAMAPKAAPVAADATVAHSVAYIPDCDAMAACVAADAMASASPVTAEPVATAAAVVEPVALVGAHHNGLWSDRASHAPKHLASPVPVAEVSPVVPVLSSSPIVAAVEPVERVSAVRAHDVMDRAAMALSAHVAALVALVCSWLAVWGPLAVAACVVVVTVVLVAPMAVSAALVVAASCACVALGAHGGAAPTA